MKRKKKLGQGLLNVMVAVTLALGLLPAGSISAFADEDVKNGESTDYPALELPPGDNVGNRVILKAESSEATAALEGAGGEVVGKVGDVYVVEYSDERQAALAAERLDDVCEFAEVDQEVVAAADEATLTGAFASGVANVGSTKIALVDSGAPASPAVTRSLSVIGENPADESGHATEMLGTMLDFSNELEVVSVRVLNDENKGSVASLYSGIMAAIDEGVDIINLSIVTKASEKSEAIAQAVSKAVEAGIVVVAAAGNNGADAAGYMPAGAQGVVTAGSCDADGVRLASSNYGECVNVYVVSASTSYAAAMLSGWLAANRAPDGSFPTIDQAIIGDNRFFAQVTSPNAGSAHELPDDIVEAATSVTTVTPTELRELDSSGNRSNRLSSAVPDQDIRFNKGSANFDITDANTVVEGSSNVYSANGSYVQTGRFIASGAPSDLTVPVPESDYVSTRRGIWVKVPSDPNMGGTSAKTTGDNGGPLARITFKNSATKKDGTKLDFTVEIESVQLRFPTRWNIDYSYGSSSKTRLNAPSRVLIASTPGKDFTTSVFPELVKGAKQNEYYYPGHMGANIIYNCYFTPANTGASGTRQTGTKLFSVYDLDIADHWTHDYFKNNSESIWTEGVRLVNDFESTVYMQGSPMTSLLDFSKAAENGTIRAGAHYRVVGDQYDQWRTGFVARKTSSSTRFRFVWTGSNCGTKLFEEYNGINIYDRNDNSATGVSDQGIISKDVDDYGVHDTNPIGTPGHNRVNTTDRRTRLPWRGEAFYAYKARPGFKVVSVKVKGLSDNVERELTNATAAAAGTVFNDTGVYPTRNTRQDYQIVVKTAKVNDQPATFTAKKVLRNGALKNGQFTFRFYTDAACSANKILMVDTATGYIATSSGNGVVNVEGKNDANGNISFPTVNYRFSGNPLDYPKTHTYYVKEVPGTDSQITYDNQVKTITVTESYSESAGFKVSVAGNNMEFKNTYTSKTAGVKVAKVSSAAGNPPVSGVTFGVFKTSATDYGTIAQGTPVKTMTTGANGVAQLANTTFTVDNSEYRVIETGVPAGYALNTTWVGSFTVRESEPNKKIYDVGTVTNVPLGGVKAKKVDKDTSAALSGAEFSVYVAPSLEGNPAYADVLEQGTLVETMVTGADGVATMQNKLAADGKSYYLVETKAPAGYDLNTAWVKSFTLSASGQMADFTGEGARCQDKRIMLPVTGGRGVMSIMAGASVAILAGWTLRRRRVSE